MNTLLTAIVAFYLIAALLFMLFWFLPERVQDRICNIFSRSNTADRGLE